MHPEIDLDSIWYFETTVDFDKFKAGVFMEAIFWFNYKFCFNVGAFVQDILFKWTFA